MCFGIFPKCCEVLFCSVCLHAVMDYFDKVGVHNATDLGVCKAFQVAFIAQVKHPLLEKFAKYETNNMINIPKCMIHGSLRDALYMDRGSKVFRFLSEQRVYDVQEYVDNKLCIEQIQKDYEEMRKEYPNDKGKNIEYEDRWMRDRDDLFV